MVGFNVDLEKMSMIKLYGPYVLSNVQFYITLQPQVIRQQWNTTPAIRSNQDHHTVLMMGNHTGVSDLTELQTNPPDSHIFPEHRVLPQTSQGIIMCGVSNFRLKMKGCHIYQPKH